MFMSAFPILSTPDLERALRFYRDVLGGAVGYRFPSHGEAKYVGLDIESTHIGIGHDPDAKPSPEAQRISLWVYTDDCDAAVRQLRAAGTRVLEEPTDQPWGERVARVHDPDGNVVLIGSRG